MIRKERLLQATILFCVFILLSISSLAGINLKDNLSYNHYFEKSYSISTQTISDGIIGNNIEVSVITSEILESENIISFGFDYDFDNTKLEYIGYSINACIPEGEMVEVANTTPGQLNVNCASLNILSGTGNLIKFQFKIIDCGTSNLTISNFTYNDVIDVTNFTNGSVTANYFVDAGADETININSYQLNANNVLGATGVWTVETGSGIFEDNTLPNTTVNDLEYGDNTYRWTISYNGCNNFDELIIKRTVFAGYDIVIEGEIVYLSALLPEGAIGEWTIMYGTGTFEDNTDPNTKVWDLALGINIFRWTVTFPDKGLVLWDDVIVDRRVAGIIDLKAKSVIYPNPTTGIFSIIFEKNINNSNIEIYNITGSLVKHKVIEKSENEIKINLTENKKGIYFIKINDDKTSIIQKIIVH